MKPKVDPKTSEAIEKLLHEILEEDPRLRLADDEDAFDASEPAPANKSVNEIFQSLLNPPPEQAT